MAQYPKMAWWDALLNSLLDPFFALKRRLFPLDPATHMIYVVMIDAIKRGADAIDLSADATRFDIAFQMGGRKVPGDYGEPPPGLGRRVVERVAEMLGTQLEEREDSIDGCLKLTFGRLHPPQPFQISVRRYADGTDSIFIQLLAEVEPDDF